MRLKGRIKKIIFGKLPGFRGNFPYFGTRVYFPRHSLAFTEACRQGVYEIDNVQLLSMLVQPRTWFFDVGANIGLTSLPILRAHQDVSVLSFEPSPNSVPWLEKTIAKSVYTDRWHLIRKAVGAATGATEFCVSSPESGLFDSIVDTRRSDGSKKAQVEITTLDTEWIQLGQPPVSVIKIDVEGWEARVIEGAKLLLQSQKPYVLLEWNKKNLSAADIDPISLYQIAKDNGYYLATVPALSEIENVDFFKLNMLKSENFLLYPKS
jgi:FkbM family methyltransferase